MVFNKHKLNISKYLVISLGVFGIIFYTLFIIHNPARADITTGLVGWWKFDEGSGITTGDSSGSNNTGTLANGPTWTTGKIGGALSFDGVDDYVNLSTPASLTSLTYPITLSLWIKPSSLGGVNSVEIMNFRVDDPNTETKIVLYNSDLYIAGSSHRDRVSVNGIISTTNWNHIVYTIDGSYTRKLFINGVVQSFGSPDYFSPSDISIGNGKSLIDEVRIYNRALSAAEILELYNYTGGGTPTPTPTPSGTPTPTPSPTPTPTPPPDTTPPTISNGSPSGTLSAGTTQTTMSVVTDENATCKYSTSAGTSYASMPSTFSTTGAANHSTTITGLTNGNSYTRYVRCQDTAGNANTSDYVITFSVASSGGGTINAANCSRADVQAAINSANSGDTINVPAGNCTWTSTLVITKSLTLQGAGIGNINITSSVGTGNTLITYTPASPANDAVFRITGFTFNSNSNSGIITLLTDSLIPQTKIRIDHNAFTNLVTAEPVLQIFGQFYGVVDNNTFGNGPHVENFGLWSGWENWTYFTFDYGSSKCLYYEDNTIRTDDTLFTGGNGGRYCLRYNTITSDPRTQGSWGLYPFLDAHGNMGPGGNYGTMGIEVYGNNLTMINDASPGYNFIDHRGGKGLVFWNKVNLNYGGDIQGGGPREEHADTENPPANNVIDGTPQHVNNAYYWNNRETKGLFSMGLGENIGSTLIAENTDFFNMVVPFNGASGMGCGTLAARPMTCIIGVGYWATNQSCSTVDSTNVGANVAAPINGTLYKCTAPNTWAAYYTPYTYPHPLRAEAVPPDTTPPAAPSGVAVN